MPNWCWNKLEIIGDPGKINKLINFAQSKDSQLDFHKFLPYPKKFLKIDKISSEIDVLVNLMPYPDASKYRKYSRDGYTQGGYEWCINNWGTKWELNADVDIDRYNANAVCYSFDTAWNPPLGVVQAMSKKFPTLLFTITYCDESTYDCIYTEEYKGGAFIGESQSEIERDEDDWDDSETENVNINIAA